MIFSEASDCNNRYKNISKTLVYRLACLLMLSLISPFFYNNVLFDIKFLVRANTNEKLIKYEREINYTSVKFIKDTNYWMQT